MNYSTFEISALWHWIERLFVYQADSPLMMGSIPFALLFIFFLAIYTLLKSYSRTAMMMYVICFSLFFAYKVNGMVMWMLPLTACINYAVTQEMRLHEGKARKALLTFVVLVDLASAVLFQIYQFHHWRCSQRDVQHQLLPAVYRSACRYLVLYLPGYQLCGRYL